MPLSKPLSLGQRLRHERERCNWSQERLAEAVGVTARSINRWEQDKAIPYPHYREQLCRVFNVATSTLFGTSSNEEVGILTQYPLWNVPYVRNFLFTGRETLLERLHDVFLPERTNTPTGAWAISGMGGVGKTQIAIEYAYRYQKDYQAILWVRAEARETFIADLVALAELLTLPERHESNQRMIVEAVKRWLHSHDGWLLILDNVEDILMVADLFPSTCQSQVVLTTRLQASGSLVQRIDVMPMGCDESILFLLRRAKLLDHATALEAVAEEMRGAAGRIWHTLGGLPLALDQAGAYIEETGCGLVDYLDRYQTCHAALLNRRGSLATDHLESVTTTLSLCFEKVKQVNPAAAELLRFCAFLHPDAIAEELIGGGACELGPVLGPLAADPLALDGAIKDLRAFSLVQRHAETKTLSFHRLVQTVIKERMDENTQRQWAERAIRVVNRGFPDSDVWETWPSCQRYLPHAYSCALLIEQWNVALPQGARLIYQTAYYLLERAMYPQAEVLYRQALTIRERLHGPLHPDVAECLNDLAVLSYYQGKYDQAEPLFLQALAIRERTQGPDHPELVHTQCNLAHLYYVQGKYAQVEPLLQRALAVREHVLGSEHPLVAESLMLLANLYCVQQKYAQADQLYRQSLAICEHALGPEHPQVAQSLKNWARLYHVQGKYTQAEPLLQRALAIREQTLGSEHPKVAACLNNLAELCQAQDKYVQAEVFYRRALMIWEKALGPDHPQTTTCSEHYADLLRKLK